MSCHVISFGLISYGRLVYHMLRIFNLTLRLSIFTIDISLLYEYYLSTFAINISLLYEY